MSCLLSDFHLLFAPYEDCLKDCGKVTAATPEAEVGRQEHEVAASMLTGLLCAQLSL